MTKILVDRYKELLELNDIDIEIFAELDLDNLFDSRTFVSLPASLVLM